MAGQARPVVLYKGTILSAAALWSYLRYWLHFLRQNGLKSGSRILLSYQDPLQFLFILLAGLYENYSIFIAPAKALPSIEVIKQAGIALYLIDDGDLLSASVVVSKRLPKSLSWLENNQTVQPDGIRIWIPTSGSGGMHKWIGLSDEGLWSVLDSHRQAMAIPEGARVYSYLPWNHIFGLVLDCLLALFSRAELLRSSHPGHIEENLAEMTAFDTEYLSSVPFFIQKILLVTQGATALQRLQGGIIGGAPVNRTLANFLANTRLRVGYGQTEASPGICLGQPGVWSEGYLGKPLACQVRINEQDELEFRGKNVYYADWQEDGFHYHSKQRWQATGDRVEALTDGGFRFLGRCDTSFKLSNGFFVHPHTLECKLQQQIPSLQEVLIGSQIGGEELFLLYSADSAVDEQKIRDLLVKMEKKVSIIKQIDFSEWIRTPKGEIQRKKMAEKVKDLCKQTIPIPQ